MILSSEKVRKSCGYDTLVKAKGWGSDSCTSANNNWLYPLTDALDNFVHQQKYTNFT